MLDTTTFVGLDVHARSIKAVSLDVMTGEVRAATFGYDAGAVAAWVRSVDPKARCVYESGVTGFDLQKRLSGLGVDCAVGAVSKMIKPSADRRRKNDRNDAEFLARMLSVGNVVEVWVTRRRVRGRPRPDQGARGREGRPLALEAAALQVPAQARARLRREDAHRPQEGQLDPGALVLDRVDKVRGGGRQRGARLLRRRGQAGGGGEGEARGARRGRGPQAQVEEEGRLPALPQGRRHRFRRRPRVRGRRVLQVQERPLVRRVGRPDALRALQRGERPQGRDHQGRQQAPEEDAGRGRVALPDVLRAAEGPRQGPGPGPGRPEAVPPRACGGWSTGGRRCSRAGSTATRRTWPRRASSPAGCGRSASWPRRHRGRSPEHKPVTPEAVRSEAVEANLRSLFCERPGRHTRAQTVGST